MYLQNSTTPVLVSSGTEDYFQVLSSSISNYLSIQSMDIYLFLYFYNICSLLSRQSAFYFDGGMYHFDEAGLTHKNDTTGELSAYKVHDEDALYFASGG